MLSDMVVQYHVMWLNLPLVPRGAAGAAVGDLQNEGPTNPTMGPEVTTSASAQRNNISFSLGFESVLYLFVKRGILKSCNVMASQHLLNENGIPRFEDLPVGKNDPHHSAWGLYGKDDELGTLNRLTNERVVEAARKEIQSGERFVQFAIPCRGTPVSSSNCTRIDEQLYQVKSKCSDWDSSDQYTETLFLSHCTMALWNRHQAESLVDTHQLY
jgi:hypothetical protein